MIESILTGTTLKELDLLQCDFHYENELFTQITSACLTVETLAIKCDDYDEQYAALSSLLCQKSMLRELVISYDGLGLSKITPSLAKNQKITKLTVKLTRDFEGEDIDQIQSLLCDTTSIDNIIKSNHTLEEIKLFEHGSGKRLKNVFVKDCLVLNKNHNKTKVAQKKISQYYFVEAFDMSPFVNMPYALLPKVISIIGGGWRNRHTAQFRILKSIPNLVDASHVDQVQPPKTKAGSLHVCLPKSCAVHRIIVSPPWRQVQQQLIIFICTFVR